MFDKLVRNEALAAPWILPNFQQTVSAAIVVAGIGLFSIKSADGKTVSPQMPPVSQTSSSVIHPETQAPLIAQIVDANSPIYGNWSLRFSVDGLVYESVLVMRGYSGVMRTSYFDPKIGSKQIVDQEMRLKSSSQGLVLLGYNPVYAGTSRRHPTYAADNFLFSIDPDGSLRAFTCDDRKQCSAVDVETIASQP
jgi:hypothetical protein